MAGDSFTIVHWIPEIQKHKCGYCKQLNTNCSYGMWAECMTVETYQNLIDRGWRRSGKYLYKSLMDMTCCPLYTIRCEAVNFKLTKSQKKNIKRLNRFLSEQEDEKSHKERPEGIDDDTNESDIEEMHQQEMMFTSSALKVKGIKKIDVSKINTDGLRSRGVTATAASAPAALPCSSEQVTHNVMSQMVVGNSEGCTANKEVKAGVGADPLRPPAKKAKLLRLERKQQKLAAKGVDVGQAASAAPAPKSLEQFIEEGTAAGGRASAAHKLQVRLVLTSGGAQRDWSAVCAQEYHTYRKYQMLIHNDSADRCSEKQFTRFLLDSPLEIVLKRMSRSEPSFVESANLYAKYQMFVHNDAAHECDDSSFVEFLVNTPLKHWRPGGSGGGGGSSSGSGSGSHPEHGYGSFHQQYWLDGKLIAVGVIDVLPRCVSSVYFFYDPEYRHLTLGTYGSLYEVYWTRQLQRTAPALQYYYMGFYIHTCAKMRYKARLSPSFLLCPETYEWFPVERCMPKLQQRKYSRLHEEEAARDADEATQADVDSVAVLLDYRTCVPLRYLRSKVPVDEAGYTLFAKLVGRRTLPHMLLVARSNHF